MPLPTPTPSPDRAMTESPTAIRGEGRTASGAQCRRTTTNRPPDCGDHPLPLDDPRLHALVGVDVGSPMVLYKAPRRPATDTPLPLGCGVITVRRAGGYYICDDCSTLGRSQRDISDHIRRFHVALPAFGLVADAIRTKRSESA